MTVNVSAKWLDGLRFEGEDSYGQTFKMVPPPREGEADGLVPMEMLLLSVAGCTGIDVVNVLRKKRQMPDDLNIEVTGEKRKELPFTWETIHIKYIIKGDVTEEAAEHAIGLSMEKYCSCSIMLRAKAKITHEYVIEKE